jgi:hypothetical protein
MTASSIIAIFKPLAQPAQRFIGLLKIRARERHCRGISIEIYTLYDLQCDVPHALAGYFWKYIDWLPRKLWSNIFYILYGCAVERARVVIF